MFDTQVRISGKGCVSAAGIGTAETRTGLYASGAHAAPAAAPDEIGCTLKDLPCFHLNRLVCAKTESRSLLLLRTALDEALADAGIEPGQLSALRVGVCLGTTVACQLNNLEFYRKIRAGEPADSAPARHFQERSPAAWLKRNYGLTGPAVVISNACVSSADAIALGALWIRSGQCDLVLAGGMDELNRIPMAGFHALGVAGREHCRPFDRGRSGLNLGEGAGMVILESEESLRKRGAATPFFLAGAAGAGDAHHITAPHGRGLTTAIRNALNQAGLSPERIEFVNAHGTGTANNDLCESTVLATLFGPSVRYLSTKGITGHTLGGAGALEFIFTLLMLEERRIPGSFRFEEHDPAIPVDPVREETLLPLGRYALSTSLAFGGCNTALIAGRSGAES